MIPEMAFGKPRSVAGITLVITPMIFGLLPTITMVIPRMRGSVGKLLKFVKQSLEGPMANYL